jgi:hypothetical protein
MDRVPESDFQDDRDRQRACRVVEYVGAGGVGVFATRGGRILLASGVHPLLAPAVLKIADVWRAHPLASLPSPLGARAFSDASPILSTCVATCFDGLHVLASPVGQNRLLITLISQGIPASDFRGRLERAAALLERFSLLGAPAAAPTGGGPAPANAAVYADDDVRPRRVR